MAITRIDKSPAFPYRGTARVMAKDRLTPQVFRLRLDLEDGGDLNFTAGQYLRLYLGGFEPRDYSIANQPGEGYLEFHIRDQGEGGASSFVRNALKPGDRVEVEGPFGSCTLRCEHNGPILGIAGGTGLAPIKGILEQALELGWRNEVRLYFGVNQAEELYLLDHFSALEKRFSSFTFVPVAMGQGQLPEGCRRGLVTDALTEDLLVQDDISDCEAYIAGPPAMVEAAVALLRSRGLEEDRIHADAFTLGPALPQDHDREI